MGTTEEFDPLEDPRLGNVQRHSLHEILVISPCTIFMRRQNVRRHGPLRPVQAGVSESFLPLRNGIHSHGSFSRAYRLLDPEAFQKWFLRFMGQFVQGCKGVLAIDGKAIRRSYNRAKTKCRCTWSMPGPHNSAWC